MRKLHVILHREELDSSRLSDKVVLVLDVLFATSTIVAACDHGVADIIPALDEAEARQRAAAIDSGDILLAGERDGELIEGFAPPTPVSLSQAALHGKHLIYATTNGTVALRAASAASWVYAAALLNGHALVDHVLKYHTQQTVLIICAGTFGRFNLEDFYGAGYLVHRFLGADNSAWDLSDSAISARTMYQSWNAFDCLSRSRVGRIATSVGLVEEVRFAAREGVSHAIPYLDNGRIRSAGHAC